MWIMAAHTGLFARYNIVMNRYKTACTGIMATKAQFPCRFFLHSPLHRTVGGMAGAAAFQSRLVGNPFPPIATCLPVAR